MDYIWGFFKGVLGFLGLYKKSGSIIFLGLDNAGKTTLLKRLMDDKMTQQPPTVHAHVEKLTLGKINFTAIDIGGHKNVRKTWKNYLPTIDAIIYMVDAAASKRFAESKQEFDYILQSTQTKKVPIVVLGNKTDKEGAVPEDVLRMEFGLAHKSAWGIEHTKEIDGRPVDVYMCSVAKKQGYAEAFRWISTFLK